LFSLLKDAPIKIVWRLWQVLEQGTVYGIGILLAHLICCMFMESERHWRDFQKDFEEQDLPQRLTFRFSYR
jgi:hypothetical protein